jgi:hypothetical protein
MPPPPPGPPAQPHDGRKNSRQGLAVAGVAVVVVGALAVGMAVADDDSAGEAGGGSWDSIAAVDRETGEVTILDRDGVEIGDPLDTGIEELGYVLGDGSHLALVATDAAGVIDVATGTVEAPALPGGGRAVRVLTSEPLVLAAGRDEGGDVTIISATTSLDVAESARLDDALMFPNEVRSDVTGTRFAVADLRTLQTVVVGSDRDDALVLPGVPVALTDELTVTAESQDEQSQVQFWSMEGDRIGSVEVARVRAGLIGANDDTVLVTEEDEVLQVSPGDDEARLVATLEPPGALLGAVPALEGQRLVLAADRGVVVLDEHGEVVATLDLGEPWRRQPLVTNPSQRCVVVMSESGRATMLDLESGETLGAVDDVTLVNAWSTDGCTASLIRPDDSTIVRVGTEVTLDPEETVVAIAPTGDHVVVRDGSGEAWLRDLDDDAEDVALSSGARLFAFVDH